MGCGCSLVDGSRRSRGTCSGTGHELPDASGSAGGGSGGGALRTATVDDVLLVLPCQTGTEDSAATVISSSTGGPPWGELFTLMTHPKTSPIGITSRLGKHATSPLTLERGVQHWEHHLRPIVLAIRRILLSESHKVPSGRTHVPTTSR